VIHVKAYALAHALWIHVKLGQNLAAGLGGDGREKR
jgi:hypothetical protein